MVHLAGGDLSLAPVVQEPRHPRRTRSADQHTLAAYLFLSPSLLFFSVFFVFPALFTLYLSLHEWNMLSPVTDMTWQGVSNYTALLQDPRFLTALRNTLVYTLACLVLMPPLALGVALLLQAVKHGRWFWRTVYFLPVLTSSVAMSVVWTYMFDATYGPIDAILVRLHIPPQGWIASPRESLLSVIIVTLWQGIGYYSVLYLAGLQGISEEYYEAASLDGAGSFRKFWNLTLPLLKQTHVFVLVMVAINSLQVFTQVYVITSGGPADSSNVLVLYIYQTAFAFLHMGKATAMAVVLFAIVLIVTVFQLRLLRNQAEGESI